MAFKITPYGGAKHASDYADHHDIRAYLGWGKTREYTLYDGSTYASVVGQRLPIGFQGWTIVPLMDGRETKLICLPGNPSTDGRRGKSSAHRCFAVCPDCGAHVPAGRTHQHKCK